MAKIIFEGTEVVLAEGETVLSGLTRSGFNIPNSCNTGFCQSCIMHAEGDLPRESQKGLKPSQKAVGKFLSCCCKPTDTLKVSLAKPRDRYSGVVLAKTQVSDDVLILKLSKEFDYQAGQFMTLFNSVGDGRCYSFASHPTMDDFIELHIRVLPDGLVSRWVQDDLKVGDSVQISGPFGECFYSPEDKDQPLFLCGISTGFAPLLGILRDALYQGHRGKIYFLIGSKTQDGLYYKNFSPSVRNNQVTIHQVALDVDSVKQTECFQANIYDYAKSFVPDMKGIKVYLCGAESFVLKMKKQSFLLGANMKDIYADAFVHAKDKEEAA